MDQGLHNWLVYTGLLDLFMDVKVVAVVVTALNIECDLVGSFLQVYQQGEGPVNTVGGFMGKHVAPPLLRPLREWGVLVGPPPLSYVLNWNGEQSPVVHQLDRFQ